MTYYIAQAFGIVGMVLSIASFQYRENKRFFVTQAASGTYDGWLSILVLAAQLVGTAVMWTDSGTVIRVAQLAFVSPAWLTHNIICGSLGAILCEIFAITSTVISLIRFRKNGFASAGEKHS